MDGAKRGKGKARWRAAARREEVCAAPREDAGEETAGDVGGRTEGLGPLFRREVYAEYVKKHARPSPLLRDVGRAFWVGGGLCALGEGLFWLFRALGAEEERGRLLVTLAFIALAGVLTAAGWFDRIARFGGAGTLVPVTGFSNSVVAAAMDNRSEGMILGVGAKMFAVAGPVIVYGTAAGAIFGVLYWLVGWIGDKL
jgi:stage V sporulation protein AC